MWRFVSIACFHRLTPGMRPTNKILHQKGQPSSQVLLCLLQKNHNISTAKPHLHRSRSLNERRKPYAWFLLLIPATTFGLGTWQVKRWRWKLSLIEDLESRTKQNPFELPDDWSDLEKMEYYPVKVKGKFDHTREVYLGPRSLIIDGDAANQGSLMSQNSRGQSGGYCVVTPFKLSDRNCTILVNRGWVPGSQKNPATRSAGQVEDEQELTGFVRLSEKRAPFMPANKPNAWFYRDVESLAEMLNTDPVFIDASIESTVPGGPQGGQTRLTLRNEHLSYIITWYGLSAATAIMWYKKFIH